MPVSAALLGMILLGGLSYLQARTIYRSAISGTPYLFFWPHPAYKNQAPNKNSKFFWFSIFSRAWGLMVFTSCTLVCAAFLFGLG